MALTRLLSSVSRENTQLNAKSEESNCGENELNISLESSTSAFEVTRIDTQCGAFAGITQRREDMIHHLRR